MTRTLSLLILLIASHAFAQSVSVPTAVRGLPGTFVVVRATTDGGSVQWYSCDPGLSLIPPELLKDGKAAVVMAPQSGRYRLIAWTAKGDVPSPPAVCVVIVGEPGPDPGPGPKPPMPDPLAEKLQPAYDHEKNPDALRKMVDLFAAASVQVMDANVKTTGQMLNALQAARKAAIGDALDKTREVIADHLDATLGTADTSYTPAMRELHSATFTEVSRSLGRIKP